MKARMEGSLKHIGDHLSKMPGDAIVEVEFPTPATRTARPKLVAQSSPVKIAKKAISARRTMSAEARKRIAEAQRARWAKVKKTA
jgi:hypothetical protein